MTLRQSGLLLQPAARKEAGETFRSVPRLVPTREAEKAGLDGGYRLAEFAGTSRALHRNPAWSSARPRGARPGLGKSFSECRPEVCSCFLARFDRERSVKSWHGSPTRQDPIPSRNEGHGFSSASSSMASLLEKDERPVSSSMSGSRCGYHQITPYASTNRSDYGLEG